VLAEVSPTGTITSSRNYDVYGNVRSGVNPTGTSAHKFVGNLGHPSDNNTGLIYMQARYMDPATGRFVSEDPGRHGPNLFVYCNSSPVNQIDKDGRNPFLIIGGLLLLAGIIGGIMECLAHGWSLKYFMIGFLVAAVTMAGGLAFGVPGGAIAGAIMGGLEAYWTGGNVGLGILFGTLFGAAGGLSEGAIEIMGGLSSLEVVALVLLSADEGLLTGDLSLATGI